MVYFWLKCLSSRLSMHGIGWKRLLQLKTLPTFVISTILKGVTKAGEFNQLEKLIEDVVLK